MPLFFFCSGFFYQDITTRDNALSFVKKKFVGLYSPFVKWSVLFLLLHNLLLNWGIYNAYCGYYGGSSFYSFKDIMTNFGLILFTMHGYEELLGGFWFIRALFVSSLLIVIISILLRSIIKYKYEIVCLLLFVMTVLIRRFAPDTDFWWDISMGTLGAVFYLMGFLLKQYEFVWQNSACAFFCCIPLLFSFFYFKDTVGMGCGYNKVFLFSISAVTGSLLTLYLSKYIEKKIEFIKNVLYYIGNHTFVILALHFLSFRFVSLGIVILYGFDVVHIAEHPVIMNPPIINSYWWIVYSIVGIIFPLFFNSVWQIIFNFISRKG